jgi:hypothetical protein
MSTIYIDRRVSDDARRHSLYSGDLYAHSGNSGSESLCALARELSEKAFAPHNPEVAQESMPVEEYVAILGDLKPTFIHHPTAKVAIPEMLSALGCDLEKTYFDVPRLRTMAHGEYLKAGLALQFHPHRDTWFSAPQQQINWWLPVYEIEGGNSMGFHVRYFDTQIQNSSADYDYDEWTRTGRKQAGQNVTTETRKQPQPQESLDLSSEVRVVTPVAGVLIFSAAQLHATVPNMTSRTRFSIDFRTVNLDDLVEGIGAPNVDAACSGTTLRDFMRASDLEPLPDALIEAYRRPRERPTKPAALS